MTIVAVVVVAPAWAWWSGALGHTIDGARLLGSPNVATLVEVLRESPFAARTIAVAAIAGAALALLLNPFLAGGVIGALVREPGVDGRCAGGRGARFAADGVRLYGPLLRVSLIVWPLAAIAIAAAAIVAAHPARRHVDAGAGPRGRRAVVACGDAGDGDARRSGADPRRRAQASAAPAPRCWPRFASPAARRRGCSLLGLAFGTALALAAAALLAVRGWLSGETWPSILAGVAVQQAHAFARTWLRAALVASEVGAGRGGRRRARAGRGRRGRVSRGARGTAGGARSRAGRSRRRRAGRRRAARRRRSPGGGPRAPARRR